MVVGAESLHCRDEEFYDSDGNVAKVYSSVGMVD